MATVRSKRLGRELRRLRETAGLTRDEAIIHLGWSRSKIERIETGINVPTAPHLETALELYGAPPEQADALKALRTVAKKRGWWATFSDVFDSPYVGLEDDAVRIRSWQPQLIPGLLQTEDYARAVIEAARPIPSDASDEDRIRRAESIDRRVRARAARRPLLRRTLPPAPELEVVLDEAALLRQVGGEKAMRMQLLELLTVAQRPNVTIRVLPFSAGAHAGIQGSFVLLSFDGADDPDVVYVESPAGDLYPEAAKTVTEFNLAWKRLIDVSLPHQESVALLTDLTKE